MRQETEEDVVKNLEPSWKGIPNSEVSRFALWPKDSHTGEQINLLVEAALKFTSILGPVRRTRLQKLFFLAELHHYSQFGENPFDLHFISYMYGPFTWALSPFGAQMNSKLEQDERASVRREGDWELGCAPDSKIRLQKEICDTVEMVADRFGKWHIEALLKQVNSLSVYQEAPFGYGISWCGVPKCDVLEVSPSEVKLISSYDKLMELRRYRPEGWKKPSTVMTDEEIGELISE